MTTRVGQKGIVYFLPPGGHASTPNKQTTGHHGSTDFGRPLF
jgi:hypothetical protein